MKPTSVEGWLASPDARAFAHQLAHRARLGIGDAEIVSEALLTLANRDKPFVCDDPVGAGRARLVYATRTLVRRELRHRRATPVEDRPPEHHDLDDLDWIERLQWTVTDRVAGLGDSPADRRRAHVLASLLALLAIAANGGALPSAVPERSDRLEAWEVDLLAATWLAAPRLRHHEERGPAAVRKARGRLVAQLRDEFRQLLEEVRPCIESY